jgi:hypothetical protein
MDWTKADFVAYFDDPKVVTAGASRLEVRTMGFTFAAASNGAVCPSDCQVSYG